MFYNTNVCTPNLCTLAAIKQFVVDFCNKVYARSGVSIFLIVKDTKETSFHGSLVDTIDSYDLYTTIPHKLV